MKKTTLTQSIIDDLDNMLKYWDDDEDSQTISNIEELKQIVTTVTLSAIRRLKELQTELNETR